MNDHEDNNNCNMSTPYHRTGSGLVQVKREKSNICFRGSHEYGQGIRKCHGFIGKDKSKKCECICHLGENNG